MGEIRHYRDLDVYQNGMSAIMKVFELTKLFPTEERYSLIDQMRRSSRSVCSNIAEAWRKRRYEAAFIAKLSDAETEAAETQAWAEVAVRHEYIDEATFRELNDLCDKIMGQLVIMADHPEKWILRPRK